MNLETFEQSMPTDATICGLWNPVLEVLLRGLKVSKLGCITGEKKSEGRKTSMLN